MGEDRADKPIDSETSELAPISAEQIAGTWCGDTGIAIRNDASPTDATRATDRPPPPAPAPPPPTRFTVVRELGRGGMGRVDEVYDAVLGRSVAQKSVLPGAGLLPTTLLVSEAQTCAQLEHPSIVPVYDFGPTVDGFPQYTMRLVRGRTFRDVLDERESSGMFATLAQRLGVLRQVSLAVAYAHERGVVHRDLKPDNVICGEFGEVYVLDWGIAHLLEGSDVRRTKHQDVQAGSPGYMAPEQVLGKKITAATDSFALGAMLYEVVTGERAFEDRDVPSILRRCAVGLDGPPSAKSARVPRAFDALIAASLGSDPAERPSARAFAASIDAFLDGERARVEREREANVLADEGEAARGAFEEHTAHARRLREEALAILDGLPVWADASQKEALWEMLARADSFAGDAARDLARAQTEFARALGRVPQHARARAGLASLHYRSFQSAELEDDAEQAAQQLALARSYDDGALALELANEGVLVVEANRACRLSIERSVPRAGRLVFQDPVALAPASRTLLESGSYLIRATDEDGREICYPVVIERAQIHRVRLRFHEPARVPPGFIVVPGGRFKSAANAKATRMVERVLPDFCISRFPVTFREYASFLDELGDAYEKRLVVGDHASIRRDATRGWCVTEYCVEGDARRRVPPERELDLPAAQVSWFDALAFAQWKSASSGRSFRLPTEHEWEKALRGADGRRFAMGNTLDPCFAKLRESRPETAQPEPVGAFELDESPYGVRDLTGGVGDWTATMSDGGVPPTLDDETSAEVQARLAVWRGGSWGTTALFPHAMRYTDPLAARRGWIGFRLALSLDEEGSSELTVEPMRRR